jgi:hypothetical protein
MFLTSTSFIIDEQVSGWPAPCHQAAHVPARAALVPQGVPCPAMGDVCCVHGGTDWSIAGLGCLIRQVLDLEALSLWLLGWRFLPLWCACGLEAVDCVHVLADCMV